MSEHCVPGLLAFAAACAAKARSGPTRTIPAAPGGSGAPAAPAWPGTAGPAPAPHPRGHGPVWGCPPPHPHPPQPGSPCSLGAAVPLRPGPNRLGPRMHTYWRSLTPITSTALFSPPNQPQSFSLVGRFGVVSLLFVALSPCLFQHCFCHC